MMGQLAVIDYPEGTSDICENQAMFAVTLRVIKELKIAGASDQISDAYIELAEAGYPMISKVHGADYANHNMDGIYYNGGSWMRIEICGYVAGKLHGWTKADRAIANRLWAETNTSADFPASQEYLATDPLILFSATIACLLGIRSSWRPWKWPGCVDPKWIPTIRGVRRDEPTSFEKLEPLSFLLELAEAP